MRNRLAGGLALVAFLCFSITAGAQLLQPVGPPGGDVRSLVADPRDARVLYLGTSDGHLFGSRDGGGRWQQLSRIGEGRDTVVMSLLVDSRDSRSLFAGTWSLSGAGGGVYQSKDQGQRWHLVGLAGQTVRMVVQSSADPEILVAATVEAVFRSKDSGRNWERLTPSGHADLRNFDSAAIDPRDAEVIYAGTYHLAWKTTDGGRNWTPIHRGMIDDSDVMDIEIDRTNPDRVFATACSGMYRSENRGELWSKIKGIPPTSRRTHLIQQDPQRPQTLYAGTTQGLWKSMDDGATWKRMTPVEYSIIGLVIDPRNPERLVIGTERRGIFRSEDGGTTFRASNEGFHHQQMVAFAVDATRPERMLLVLTNSAQPVQATADGGRSWFPLGGNLRIEELRRVYGAEGVWWAALRRGGLLRYDEKNRAWARAGTVKEVRAGAPAKPAKAPGKKGAAKAPAAAAVEVSRELNEVVYDMAFARTAWYVATFRGVLVSRDRGVTWREQATGSSAHAPVHSILVSADDAAIYALSPRMMIVSTDSGRTWSSHRVGFEDQGELRLHRLDAGTFAATTSRGLYLSTDGGREWKQSSLPELFLSDFVTVEDVYVVASRRGGLYLSGDKGRTWSQLAETVGENFPLLGRSEQTQMVLAASATEGLRGLRVSELRARAAGSSDAVTARGGSK